MGISISRLATPLQVGQEGLQMGVQVPLAKCLQLYLEELDLLYLLIKLMVAMEMEEPHLVLFNLERAEVLEVMILVM